MTRGSPSGKARKPCEFLTPLTGLPKRKKYLVADVESKDGPSQRPGFTRPFLFGVRADGVYHGFRNQPDARSHDWAEAYFKPGGCIDAGMRFMLQTKFRGCVIYAHNGGKFDWLFLLPWLTDVGRELGFDFEVVPTQSSIQILDVFRRREEKKARWRFLDSIKLIPTTLDKAAKAFGFAGKLEHSLEMHEADPQWEVYNAADCEQLDLVVGKFHDLVEGLGGEVGITAPSTSMKLFRRQYLKGPIPRVRALHDFLEQAYFGGRVEPFIAEGYDLSYWDFNSSYPRAMLEPMPAGNAFVYTGTPPAWVLQDKCIGFAECDVYLPPSCNIPPLPMRLDGKLCFPVGRLHGIWDTAELDLVEQCGGYIERWYQSAWFPGKAIFKQMVEDLYPYRDTSRANYDAGIAAIVKILLNALYGKFGQKTERRKIIIASRSDGDEIPEGAVPAIPDDPDCLVWYLTECVDPGYRMPQVAAHVTALARVRLWRKMREVEAAGHHVYYCDTDSIITEHQFADSPLLGELKNEYPGETFHARFLGPKLYLLDNDSRVVVRAKGLTKGKRKGESEQAASRRMLADVLSYASGETLTFERLEKIGTLARDNFRRGPQMRVTPKSNRNTSHKRVLLDDGTTRPLEVEQW